MAHVKGIELEEYTLKLMERFEHLYNGTVSGELHKGYNINHHMFYLVWNDMPWIEFGIVTPERGCFHGTVENFLKDNEKAHKDKRPEAYEIYRDLLPILQKQVLKVANDTPEYDEDEE